ncbi:nicotinate-nucleotide--dimethylbenzimidazole phosphoribosyltransferase [Tepidibacter formicigenes]|jgi:nicotinate-nucleotide--dimethylbenzimidazole phosphoribosyltransferase|uniref:Nicotinate-nucleotide--dimethylbenzimidazole phosphoribosyltransferase n=1 Tax=Tepidibacter formicigenes DSM 15518 TaxID=1123349 RepID=A0A1M6PTV4_9FIRM|nr:nicotinate-nucleotide--dimethylbenzimidazole phosphoribosyltransferase [Tepidibacter formicigenes]SHK11377.1 nicotinate-nucleotide-dimethylbenzimidazole phosphoribosyltransferase [Tepidibacter formicigenes DSM 15518]
MNLLQETINSITKIDRNYMNEAKKRLDSLFKPIGSLGKLEDICIQLAGIFKTTDFDISKKAIIAFAADHGVYEEGVAPDPQILTKLQIPNFSKGLSGVGTLGIFANAKIIAVDVGIKCDEKLEGVLDYKIRKGTSNIAKGPAMTKDEAVKSLEIGIKISNDLIKDGYNILGIGEMGIGNTTATSAIISVFGDFDPIEVTDMGSGLNSKGIIKKANVIKKAITLNNPDKNNPIDVLSKVGGFEIGAMAGVILGASARRVPVVIDGFISYASALIAYNLNTLTKEYMIPSHFSKEIASSKALNLLGLEPMLYMNMRLGEGSGAALAFNIIDSANYMYKNMITREEAYVSI